MDPKETGNARNVTDDTAYREIHSTLCGARNRLALSALTGGIVRLLCVAGAALAIVLILAALLPSSVPGALTLGLLWLSVVITAVGAFIVLPLVRLPSLEKLAVRIDDALVPGANPLISSLQLGRKLRDAGDDPFVSRPIMRMAVKAGAEKAVSMNMKPVTGDPKLGKWLRQLALVAVLAAAIVALWPGQLRTSVWRLTHPYACGPAPVRIAVTPGHVELDAGSDLEIEAVVAGTSEPPALRLRKRGGVWKRADMKEVSPSKLKARELPEAEPEVASHCYAVTLSGLQEDREYYVSVGENLTETWNIKVNQPPRAVAFRMRYAYPDYTGLPPNETVSASGDVAALKGATVEIEISANRELEGSVISFESGDTLRMTPTSPRSFAGAFRLMSEDAYTVAFTEPNGRERTDPRRFALTPLPDHKPLVRILSPDRSVDLPSDMEVDVSAYAADDYGLTSLALVYFMEGGEEYRSSIGTFGGAPREIHEVYAWDLTELGLLPGEVVYYSVEVLDNDTVSGPKASRSEIHSVRFPTMAEIYEDVEQDYETGIDELTDALRRGRELRERLEEVMREVKSAEELTWEQRQSISGAVDEREKLGESVKQVTESLEEVVDKMGGSELVDEEVFEKIMEIQKLLSEISDPKLLESIQQLNEALQNVDQEAVAAALEELKANQEQILKNLDKTIELLKRLKAEEQMQAALEQIEDLLAKQDEINSRLEKDSPSAEDLESMAGEESEVKEGLGDLEKSLKEVEEALSSIDPQAASEMGEQAKQASEEGLQKDAQQAMDQMQAGAPQPAMQSGQKVSKGLSSMAKSTKSAMEAMQQRLTAELTEKLRKAAEDLVFVSKEQEGVVSSAEPVSPQDLARRQFQVHSGAAQVADDLEEVIRSSFSISSRLGRDLGDALLKMEKATRDFSNGRKQSGLADGWAAVPSLNKAAIELMKAGQEMASSSCPNPSGSRSARQQMQKLCGMQNEVNMGTQGLVKRIQKEGGRLQPSTGDQLARLAAQQEMVRKGMKEVAGELGDRKDVLGRLDDLVEEMQDVVDEMQRQHVDRKTVRRQQRILSRLLDAQRSIRQRDLSQERISRTGVDPLGRISPDAIPPDLLESVDRVRAEVLRGKADPVPASYRRLVEEYFRAISSKGF